MIPGEIFIKDGEIELNAGRKTVTLTVANTGDRPIQVGSHYHFFETNPALKFDRKNRPRGMRLDIAGRHRRCASSRGAERARCTLVPLIAASARSTVSRGDFRQHIVATSRWRTVMSVKITRSAYADMFGPTTGDRVRLADTELIIEVEKDFTTYGEEVKFGGGKVIRDGMGQSQVTNEQGAVDTVITNALILDHWGIVKADVGIKDGRIGAIGKAGNPDIQPGVNIIIGPGTEVIAGEGKILTAGGFDSAHPFHLPAADRRRADVRRHHHARRRHRPGARHLRDHLHARPVAYRAHDPGGRRLPDESRLCRQGQRLAARGAGRDDQGRRLRAEAARGLGHDAGRDRLLPVGRRRLRRAGDDPHRHAERSRASSRTPSRPSRAAPSTPSTPKAPAAAMRRTSSRSRA